MRDDAHRIERTYRFRNFQEALGLFEPWVTWLKPKAITPISASAGVYATISLRTKKIKGLHKNDFIMASKIDRTFGRPDSSADHH